MNTSFSFVSSARSTGGRRGIAEGHGVEPPIPFSAPPEFQGEAGIWTPEHFFTSAIAACFISTFQAIASYSKFEAQALEVSVEGQVEKGEGGFWFTRVTVRPILTIHDESDRERGLRLLEKSEKACLVSRSLKSEIVLEPKLVLAPAPAAV
jgi:organic hydroperoxide reductase OsmC/OhrA